MAKDIKYFSFMVNKLEIPLEPFEQLKSNRMIKSGKDQTPSAPCV